MRRLIILLSFSACLLSANVAIAFIVNDPLNLIQNTLSVQKQIVELTQTAARIKHEVQAAERLVNKIKDFKLSNLNDLVSQINQFRSRARSIGYTYESISRQFEKTYGKPDGFSKNFKSWQQQSDDSIKDAMVSQGLLEKSAKHMEDLDKIIEDKRASKGNADTLQAIGEINGIQSKQLADLSQIIASDARAKNSVMMEDRAKQKEQSSYEASLMKDFNKHGKSQPMTSFPSLGSATTLR